MVVVPSGLGGWRGGSVVRWPTYARVAARASAARRPFPAAS